ncbi:transcription cofactor HES-6-like isoform X2 [Catharus ustulatus]|uniref:transcription cofactor HES-6-like isoform X2 n=1 Tax=Catharus ustulatus TaxID=91951 RepID=UPI001C5B8C55|nr:transcription cofactor HES-6-like isoform X2 [Catharus ustulatus]
MLIWGYKYSRGGAAEQQRARLEGELASARAPPPHPFPSCPIPSCRSRAGCWIRMTAAATTSTHKVASTKEERKLRKPLIERKRRERINNCLDQLKETVVGAFHLDSKLEKADILEMTVKHLQNIQSSKMMADSKVGLEAQQRYSTGYIQCMHEVHNLLLTCEWMDKTLGARLLNHLLKSLPRSGEDTCKAALRSLSPPLQPLLTQKSALSPKGGSTRGTNPSQERLCPAESKQASKNSFQLPSLSVFNQVDAAPPRQVLQPNFSHNNPRMGSLDMWRPW